MKYIILCVLCLIPSICKPDEIVIMGESLSALSVEDAEVSCESFRNSGFLCDRNTKFYALDIKHTDPFYQWQWSLPETFTDLAWNSTLGAGQNIAVLDTGISVYHDDLRSNISINLSEIPNNNIDDDRNGATDDYFGFSASGDSWQGDVQDGNGHGTHVSGIIAAEMNGIGSIGVAPVSKIVPVRVLRDNGSGYLYDIALGIDYAIKRGVSVINMSLGSTGYSDVIYASLLKAREAGILVVAAAGNSSESNDRRPMYPCSYDLDNIICVAATDKTGNLADYSNWGDKVHIAAPGSDIFSTYIPNTYARMNGTSMAAPHVSGTAALVKSVNPKLGYMDVKMCILNSSTIRESLPVQDHRFLNTDAAVDCALSTVDPVPTPIPYVISSKVRTTKYVVYLGGKIYPAVQTDRISFSCAGKKLCNTSSRLNGSIKTCTINRRTLKKHNKLCYIHARFNNKSVKSDMFNLFGK